MAADFLTSYLTNFKAIIALTVYDIPIRMLCEDGYNMPSQFKEKNKYL